MQQFQLHQRVRIARLVGSHVNSLSGAGDVPAIGDVGWIVDVYSEPHEAYCVECTTPGGATRWISDFAADELEPV